MIVDKLRELSNHVQALHDFDQAKESSDLIAVNWEELSDADRRLHAQNAVIFYARAFIGNDRSYRKGLKYPAVNVRGPGFVETIHDDLLNARHRICAHRDLTVIAGNTSLNFVVIKTNGEEKLLPARLTYSTVSFNGLSGADAARKIVSHITACMTSVQGHLVRVAADIFNTDAGAFESVEGVVRATSSGTTVIGDGSPIDIRISLPAATIVPSPTLLDTDGLFAWRPFSLTYKRDRNCELDIGGQKLSFDLKC